MSDTLSRSDQAIERENSIHKSRDGFDDKGTGKSANVGSMERLLSVASGSVLVLYGLSRRSVGGLALAVAGGGLFYRGATGHCEVYSKLKISTADESSKETSGIHVEKSITIGKSPEEVYQFWRGLTNLPRFMEHVKSVAVTGEKTSHWVAKGPAGREVAWDAEIIVDEPKTRIAWRSLPNADIENAGSVRFVPAPGGRGCEVHVTLQYYPPAGVLGATIAKLFGEEPSIQITDDLRRLKRLMETGEIPTTKGQPHG
ncbi:MAG: cyclase/dehydrase [Chthonomonadaceae bacterium]|nr:cyclase/dehydrase [Chthonomonadaceae bacterium]